MKQTVWSSFKNQTIQPIFQEQIFIPKKFFKNIYEIVPDFPIGSFWYLLANQKEFWNLNC